MEYKEILNQVGEINKIALDLKKNYGDQYAALKKEADCVNADMEQMKSELAKLQEKSVYGATGQAQSKLEMDCKAFAEFARKGTGVNNTVVGPEGRFLISEEMASEIIRLALPDSTVRQLATVRTTSSTSMRFPLEDDADQAEWIGELESKPSEPVYFKEVDIQVHDFARDIPITNQMLADSKFNIEAYAMDRYAKKLAAAEENSFFKGKGPKSPEGILSCARIGSQTTATANKLTFDDLLDAQVCNEYISRTSVREKASFVIAPSALQKLRKEKATGSGQYLLPPISQGMAPTINGIPVYTSSALEEVATGKVPVVYGDFSGYTILDRMDMTVLRDPYSKHGHVTLYFEKRVGGAVVDAKKFAKVVVA